jgi:hypothetical protein
MQERSRKLYTNIKGDVYVMDIEEDTDNGITLCYDCHKAIPVSRRDVDE